MKAKSPYIRRESQEAFRPNELSLNEDNLCKDAQKTQKVSRMSKWHQISDQAELKHGVRTRGQRRSTIDLHITPPEQSAQPINLQSAATTQEVENLRTTHPAYLGCAGTDALATASTAVDSASDIAAPPTIIPKVASESTRGQSTHAEQYDSSESEDLQISDLRWLKVCMDWIMNAKLVETEERHFPSVHNVPPCRHAEKTTHFSLCYPIPYLAFPSRNRVPKTIQLQQRQYRERRTER